MQTKPFSATDIERILQQVAFYNKEVGAYVEHSVKDDGYHCSVILSNGYIILYVDEIVDNSPLPDGRLRDIAARFRKRQLQG